jgi:CRISPR-associated endonuclease Cas1
MQTESITQPKAIPVRDGIVVLSGFKITVRTDRGHLFLSDGVGRQRRQIRLAKATAKLKRLVVLGHTGSITFEALRWLHDVGAAFIHIDADGKLVTASAPVRLDDAKLRRAQATALFTEAGIATTAFLLGRKIEGQARVLEAQGLEHSEAHQKVQRALQMLEGAKTQEALYAESYAAAAYWEAFASLPLSFVKADRDKIPEHWKTFGSRSSPLTLSPRNSVNPAQSIINYTYALLESATRIALLTYGLDIGVAVFHRDQRNRASLAADVMEAIRPEADAYVLRLLQTTTLRKRDFYETREGVCRLLPPLTHAIAGVLPQFSRSVAPIVEQVSRLFLKGALEDGVIRSIRDRSSDRRLPSLLSQQFRSVGRQRLKQKLPAPKVGSWCRSCGDELRSRNRSNCDRCLRDQQREAFSDGSGVTALAKLRAVGKDPAHGGKAARVRATKRKDVARAIAAWVDDDVTAAIDYDRDILVHLASYSLGAIGAAIHVSPRYAALIRAGKAIPHRRHWAILAALAAKKVEESRGRTLPKTLA